MYRCNVLSETGSDFCATDHFPGTFANFCFMIFTQERISTYVDPFPSVNSSVARCFSVAVVNGPVNC